MEPMLRRLIGEDVDVVVRADATSRRASRRIPGQIEQVILNLAINARDAMPKGGTLTHRSRRRAARTIGDARSGTTRRARAATSCSRVTDTGTGMDAATQARVFEPFFTTKQKGKGTGLGLSTVYGIVKQSGGYIWVDSDAGRGTTFKVYLPRVDEAVEPRRPGRRPESLTGIETMLVVEDEDAVRELVRKVLERYGYTVLTAATPSEAIEIARRRPRSHRSADLRCRAAADERPRAGRADPADASRTSACSSCRATPTTPSCITACSTQARRSCRSRSRPRPSPARSVRCFLSWPRGFAPGTPLLARSRGPQAPLRSPGSLADARSRRPMDVHR